MNVRAGFDTLLTVAVACVALAMYLGRGGEADPLQPKSIDDWRELSQDGIWIGPPDAPVVIIEFVDVQCPFCRQTAERVDELLKKFPRRVALSLVHYPIEAIHPHAMAGAIALECADRQNRAHEFLSAIYLKQDSLGARPWQAYGEDAKVDDLPQFLDCITGPPEEFPRIARGLAHTAEFGVRGTPTFFVNGRFVPSLGLLDEVRQALEDLE